MALGLRALIGNPPARFFSTLGTHDLPVCEQSVRLGRLAQREHRGDVSASSSATSA